MALVELHLSALPAHVRTARLVGVAAARRAGLPDELVDELRLALGEACSRAVSLHARHAPQEPVSITVTDNPGGLTVTVTDAGPAAGPALDDVAGGLFDRPADSDDSDLDADIDADVSLAVLTGLVDDVDVARGEAGTVVTMRWPLPTRPLGASGPPSTAAAPA